MATQPNQQKPTTAESRSIFNQARITKLEKQLARADATSLRDTKRLEKKINATRRSVNGFIDRFKQHGGA